ncbi:hypothetical protein XELAEV_18015899mg [Xenopus laevis]|uniref:Uncharacterized protein n=1 Tax=Xenopus laevis TaxID=8355 RepID=A0A974DIV8_XENLA|nr:hypothetical protein XELAEV_18015899mg [Xenopus laevis]
MLKASKHHIAKLSADCKIIHLLLAITRGFRSIATCHWARDSLACRGYIWLFLSPPLNCDTVNEFEFAINK